MMRDRKTRVLLVEDCPVDILAIATALREQDRFPMEVTVAMTFAEAQGQLKSSSFDLILLDLLLPDNNGINKISHLHSTYPGIPVVIITGLEDEDLALEALRTGAADYVVKGQWNRELLVRAIRYSLERNRLENELRHAHRMEAVGRLAGGVAHDFNNLLMIVRGYAELLRDETLAVDLQDKCVQEILSAVSRATDITRQLVAFGRKQILQPTVMDCNELIHGMRDTIAPLVGPGIEVRFQLSPSPARVFVDRDHFKQAVLTLAAHARESMRGQGQLTIGVDTTPRESAGDSAGISAQGVLITVSDNGPGMDTPAAAGLFDPLSFSTARQVSLGLASVHGIVKQSGGEIEVFSRAGAGTMFRITLPEVEESATEEPLHDASGEPRGMETILVVDDEAPVRRLLCHAARELGYTVLDAANGEEALKTMAQFSGELHLMVTDVLMPGMTGQELVQRSQLVRPGLPVLFVSGHSDGVIADRGLLSPGTMFLAKPFQLQDLAWKLREAMGKPALGQLSLPLQGVSANLEER